jgi:hypothetical protein
MAGTVESPLRREAHGGFGERPGETGQRQRWNRAPGRLSETVALLAARSPKLRRALAQAKRAGHAYVVIDGALIPIDRVAADRPFYSGKHRRYGMNLQVISAPRRRDLWVSGPLPGATHDLTAARIWGIVRQPAARGLACWPTRAIQAPVTTCASPIATAASPRRRKTPTAHAQLRSPGERANAQLKTWRILRNSAAAPGAPGNSPKPSTSFKPARSEDYVHSPASPAESASLGRPVTPGAPSTNRIARPSSSRRYPSPQRRATAPAMIHARQVSPSDVPPQISVSASRTIDHLP